jgi:hypothetical protein
MNEDESVSALLDVKKKRILRAEELKLIVRTSSPPQRKARGYDNDSAGAGFASMARASRDSSATAVSALRYDAARNRHRRERPGMRGLRESVDGLVFVAVRRDVAS